MNQNVILSNCECMWSFEHQLNKASIIVINLAYSTFKCISLSNPDLDVLVIRVRNIVM